MTAPPPLSDAAIGERLQSSRGEMERLLADARARFAGLPAADQVVALRNADWWAITEILAALLCRLEVSLETTVSHFAALARDVREGSDTTSDDAGPAASDAGRVH